MIWVIDTSALIRLFVPDGPVHPEAEAAFNRASTGADILVAPQLLLADTPIWSPRSRLATVMLTVRQMSTKFGSTTR